jgi:hypothetical protein
MHWMDGWGIHTQGRGASLIMQRSRGGYGRRHTALGLMCDVGRYVCDLSAASPATVGAGSAGVVLAGSTVVRCVRHSLGRETGRCLLECCVAVVFGVLSGGWTNFMLFFYFMSSRMTCLWTVTAAPKDIFSLYLLQRSFTTAVVAL